MSTLGRWFPTVEHFRLCKVLSSGKNVIKSGCVCHVDHNPDRIHNDESVSIFFVLSILVSVRPVHVDVIKVIVKAER